MSGEMWRDAASLNVGIQVEDFCMEVVPVVRRELHEERTDLHFHAFTMAQKDSSSIYLTKQQFENLAYRLDLNETFVTQELRALVERHKASKEKRSNASQRFKRLADSDELLIDFETVHKTVSQLEESTERQRRARERAIKHEANLSDEIFWHHRDELLKLHERFMQFDKDRSGYLSHAEAKNLLKAKRCLKAPRKRVESSRA
jgi:hypothetical protein